MDGDEAAGGFPPRVATTARIPQGTDVPNLLEEAQAELNSQMREHAGSQVSYVRSGESVALTAVRGKSDLEISDAHGGQTIVQSVDWIVDPAAIVFGGEVVEPQRGDRIEHTIGATVHVHELLSLGDEPSWRWTDGFHTGIRIHTKLVDRRAA